MLIKGRDLPVSTNMSMAGKVVDEAKQIIRESEQKELETES